MALELLYKPRYVKEHPWSFVVLIVVSISMSMMLSLLLAEHIASILFICFSTFFLLPIMIQLVTTDENLYALDIAQLQKHYLFRAQVVIFGVGCLTMIAWYFFSPDNIRQLLFAEQLRVFESVSNIVSGKFLSTESFSLILWNNIKVFHSILIVSVLFGAGALFLLLWNTSVLATFVSERILTIFSSASSASTVVSQM
ncbi:MAG TPA: hypothetical protein VK158_06245, partial [Acidobacteriota bacterium]|nr:hypothetical protein [Acidobacteriota bacterium]